MAALTPAGRLQPTDTLALRKLLREAFQSSQRMSDLLLGLNRHFNDYYGLGDEYPQAVQSVVNRANEELWWRELLAAARRARPTDPQLAAFAEEFDLAPIPVETTAHGTRRIATRDLEGRVKEANSPFDILVWRTRLGEIEGRVCRVEGPAGTARGTGFLVGPDVVITNYHVLKHVIKFGPDFQGDWEPAAVVLRFDYKVLSDGAAVGPGKTYGLASDWLIDHSPYSPSDLLSTPAGEARDNELDYALVRVDGVPGRELLFPNDPNPVERGWIEVPPAGALPDFATQKALFIVQHPAGKPMQVALDTESVIEVAGQGTRLRYKTNTEHGSSGSPCFGADWHWIALHHSGDPMYPGPNDPARYNQGILVPAITKLLEERGKRTALGGS